MDELLEKNLDTADELPNKVSETKNLPPWKLILEIHGFLHDRTIVTTLRLAK